MKGCVQEQGNLRFASFGKTRLEFWNAH